MVMLKSLHRGSTAACAVLLAIPPGAGVVKLFCAEAPSWNGATAVTEDVLVVDVHWVAANVPVTVNVKAPPAAALPAGNVSVLLIAPVPLAAGQVGAGVPLAAQVHENAVKPVGSASASVAVALCAVVSATVGCAVLF